MSESGLSEEGLLRQRRNLMITSSVALLLSISGAKFTKIAFGGFAIEFAHPHRLLIALWLGLLYYLFRYLQYFSTQGWHPVRESFEQALFKTVEAKMIALARSQYGETSALQAGLSWRAFWAKKLVLPVRYISNAGAPVPGYTSLDMPIDMSRAARVRLLAHRWLVHPMVHPAFTDLALPILFACGVIIFAGFFAPWEGTFAKLFAG